MKKKKLTKKQMKRAVIVLRMKCLENALNKDSATHDDLSAFAIGDLKKELKLLKRKYSYYWRTRNKK